MMASKPKRRSALSRLDLELVKAGAVMRDAGFCICSADPVAAHAMVDRSGRVRRVHATYQDGWRATLKIYADGTGALSYAIRLVTKTRIA